MNRLHDYSARFAHEPDEAAKTMRRYRSARHAAQAFVETPSAFGAPQPGDFPVDVIVRGGRFRAARRFRCEASVEIVELRTCHRCGCTDDDACEEGCSLGRRRSLFGV